MAGDDPRLAKISSTIREIPNWPKEGILFQVRAQEVLVYASKLALFLIT